MSCTLNHSRGSYVFIKILVDVPGQCDQDSEWQCVDQQSCIDKRRRCDGYGDCADLSDEDEQLCYNCKLSFKNIGIYA